MCNLGKPSATKLEVFHTLHYSPRIWKKEKKGRFEEEKEEANAKNLKGVFAKVNSGLKKSLLVNATIFALCIFLANTPL